MKQLTMLMAFKAYLQCKLRIFFIIYALFFILKTYGRQLYSHVGGRGGDVSPVRDTMQLVPGGAGTRLPRPGETWPGAGMSSTSGRPFPGRIVRTRQLGPGEVCPGAGLSSTSG
jgi:hypothetical protein